MPFYFWGHQLDIPTLAGFTAGEVVEAAKLTAHTKTAIEVIYFKPFCHIWNSAVQSVATGTSAVTAVFDTAIEDTDDMADLTNNQIVIQTAGLYRVTYRGAFAVNSTGQRYIWCKVNGTYVRASSGPTGASSTWRESDTFTIRLAVDDLLGVGVSQNSGGNLNTSIDYGGVALEAEWISK